MLNLELPTVAPRKVKPVKSKTGRVKVRVSCFETVKKKNPNIDPFYLYYSTIPSEYFKGLAGSRGDDAFSCC